MLVIDTRTHDFHFRLDLVNLIQRSGLDEHDFRCRIRSRPQRSTTRPAERSRNRFAGVCVVVHPCLVVDVAQDERGKGSEEEDASVPWGHL